MAGDLGSRLLRHGVIERAAWNAALAHGPQNGAELVRLLVRDGAKPSAIADLFVHEGFGPLPTEREITDGAGYLDALPPFLAVFAGAIPIERRADAWVIAMIDPSDAHLVSELSRATERRVVARVGHAGTIDEMLRLALPEAYEAELATLFERHRRALADGPDSDTIPLSLVVRKGRAPSSMPAAPPARFMLAESTPPDAPRSSAPAPDPTPPSEEMALPLVRTKPFVSRPSELGPPPSARPSAPEVTRTSEPPIDTSLRPGATSITPPSDPLVPAPIAHGRDALLPPSGEEALASLKAPLLPKLAPTPLGSWDLPPKPPTKPPSRRSVPPARRSVPPAPVVRAPSIRPPGSLAPPRPPLDIGALLAQMRQAHDRDEVVGLACEGALAVAKNAIFFALRKDVFRGWDGRGPNLTRDGVRNLWIPTHSTSNFRQVFQTRAAYRGPHGRELADDIFRAAVSARTSRIALQPVIVAGKLLGLLAADDLADDELAAQRIEVLAAAVQDAFSRIIVEAKS